MVQSKQKPPPTRGRGQEKSFLLMTLVGVPP